jgi:hypothetical protein
MYASKAENNKSIMRSIRFPKEVWALINEARQEEESLAVFVKRACMREINARLEKTAGK